MIRLLLFSVAAFWLTVPAAAREASVVAPQAYKKQLENEWVKVTRVHYEQHETLGEHEHPARPTIYIYLNDGGPVLFKHGHGDSGDFAATRAATKAGSHRLAWTRKETHIVENRSDLPSDLLQVELITISAETAKTAETYVDQY